MPEAYEQEIREFAAHLSDDLGPMFGRDVLRLLDEKDNALQGLRQEIERLEMDNVKLRGVIADFDANAGSGAVTGTRLTDGTLVFPDGSWTRSK